MDINTFKAATPPDPNRVEPAPHPRPPAPGFTSNDAAAWCFAQHAERHGPAPGPGEGHNGWLAALTKFCNESGAPFDDVLALALDTAPAGHDEAKITATVQGIYRRDAADHGRKPYTTPHGNKTNFAADSGQKENAAQPVGTNWLPQLLDTRERLRERSAATVSFAPPLFFQDEEPVIWPRTLALIQGQTGAHKSRVAELFGTVLIAAQAPACDTVGLARHGEDGQVYTLCYVDTERTTSEQLPYALQQMRERAGYERTAHPPTFDYISLEPIPRAARLAALGQYLAHVRTTFAGHLLIVLDVLTDCICSFNDEKESLLLVDMLNRMINSQDVTFLCVIHENPGGAKARGHLGTEAANKASTVLQVGYMKQANGEPTEVVEMRYLKRRNGRPGLAFHVAYDEASKGLIRADPAAVAEAAARRRTVAAGPELFAALATELAFGPLAAGELERRLCARLKASPRTVRERLNELESTAAGVTDKSGRAWQLTKTKHGKETRYALVSAAGTDQPNVGTLATPL
jgi:hypothetical protein